MRSTVTSPINADGGFRITGIRPGKVSLSSFMQRGGPAALRLSRIERNGMELRDGVDVRSGEDINGLKLVLGSHSRYDSKTRTAPSASEIELTLQNKPAPRVTDSVRRPSFET